MQSFLAMGQEILLSGVNAMDRLLLKEFYKVLGQHLAPREEHAERHDEDRGFVASTGVLRAIPVEKRVGWKCKVQACTGESHHLKDCPEFGRMDPRDRVALVDRQKLCMGCLMPGHSRTAKSCPFKEEGVDACKKPACRVSHHHLLHTDGGRGRRSREGRLDGQEAGVTREPQETVRVPRHNQETLVQLVTQWVSTKAGEPCLVFWDTGSQVTLTAHKAAQAMILQAVPGPPLNLTGVGNGHKSRSTVRYNVSLLDVEGRVLLMTAYAMELIMDPMEEGDPGP
jgi:hypothetical protein